MSSYINTVTASLRRDAKWSSRGPVLRGQVYDSRFQQQVVTLDSECMHGASTFNAYGFFVSIDNERNHNKSRLKVVMPTLVELPVVTISGATGASAVVNAKFYPSNDPTSLGAKFTYRQVMPEPVNKIRVNSDNKWEVVHGASGNVLFRTTDAEVTPVGVDWTAVSGAGTLVTTSSDEGVPLFQERVTKQVNVNEFICKADEYRRIVPIDTEIDDYLFAPSFWEASINPLDEAHKEITYVLPTELNTKTENVWDENLRQFVSVSRELTQTSASPTTSVAAGVATHVYYEEIRCGWYVKTTEVFNTAVTTYWDSENIYWPPVASTAGDLAMFYPVNAKACVSSTTACGTRDTEITYPTKYIVSLKIKEAYNDVCKVKVETVFQTTVAELDIVNEVMIPQAINHDGIIQDFKLAPTLHTAYEFTEAVTSHPSIDTPITLVATYPATNETDWPDTIQRTFVTPMRGGYLKTTKTYYKPA